MLHILNSMYNAIKEIINTALLIVKVCAYMHTCMVYETNIIIESQQIVKVVSALHLEEYSHNYHWSSIKQELFNEPGRHKCPVTQPHHPHCFLHSTLLLQD